MFRVIIAGGRNFTDKEKLFATMDKLLSRTRDDITVACGKARGADTLGEEYAKNRGYSIAYYPADWDRHGRAAGFVRNIEMAQNADALVAFWDGQSRGTKHMIETAQQHGLEVRVIRY